jgi:hypothetical protein
MVKVFEKTFGTLHSSTHLKRTLIIFHLSFQDIRCNHLDIQPTAPLR